MVAMIGADVDALLKQNLFEQVAGVEAGRFRRAQPGRAGRPVLQRLPAIRVKLHADLLVVAKCANLIHVIAIKQPNIGQGNGRPPQRLSLPTLQLQPLRQLHRPVPDDAYHDDQDHVH